MIAHISAITNPLPQGYRATHAYQIHQIFDNSGVSNNRNVREAVILNIIKYHLLSNDYEKIKDMSFENKCKYYKENHNSEFDVESIKVYTESDQSSIQKFLKIAKIDEKNKISALFITDVIDIICVMFEDGTIDVNYFNTDFTYLFESDDDDWDNDPSMSYSRSHPCGHEGPNECFAYGCYTTP
jgi:hypothetical protein